MKYHTITVGIAKSIVNISINAAHVGVCLFFEIFLYFLFLLNIQKSVHLLNSML